MIAGGILGVWWMNPFASRPESATASPAFAVSPGAAAGFNVVLVTLDTTRADRIGCYGYAGASTPSIDTLAEAGVRFADAVSVVPMTLPAHASIMTGDYPPKHGVRDNGTYRLAAEHETLAERLKTHGYTTAAFIAAFVLDRRYGMDQGFEVYDDVITTEAGAPQGELLNPQRTGDKVVDAAASWLDAYRQSNTQRPFFAWIHLFDPHTPYAAPEPYRSRYAHNPYDGEVAFMDLQIGRFVRKLEALNLADNTLVVLVGDHGEGLGDHGESTHSLLIYESTIHVPLIFHSPRIIPGGLVIQDRVASIVDIVPTLLELIGLPEANCDGRSLLGPTGTDHREIYVETLAPKLNHGWSPLFALRRHGDKYIEAPTPEYYDLVSDPAERTNLWTHEPEEMKLLADHLASLMKRFEGLQPTDDAVAELDREALDKLAALGYLRGATPADDELFPDPKEMIALMDRQVTQASALVGAGRAKEAIPLIEELLKAAPHDASLWSLLSVAQTKDSMLDAAIASRLRAIDLQPNDALSWVALANLQLPKGDVEAWAISLAEAERLEPNLGAIFISRALRALHAQQYAEALSHCEQARTRDPTRYAAQARSLEAEIRRTMTPGSEEAADSPSGG